MAKAKKALPSTTPEGPKSEPTPLGPKVKKKLGSGNGDRGISFLSVYVSKITGAFANEKSKKTYDPDPVEVVPSEKKKRGT